MTVRQLHLASCSKTSPILSNIVLHCSNQADIARYCQIQPDVERKFQTLTFMKFFQKLMMSVTCYLFTICYLLSDNCYLKLATSCKNLFPFAPVVRLALVVLRISRLPRSVTPITNLVASTHLGIEATRKHEFSLQRLM